MRFGLSEAERKAVFKELAQALKRAARETRERYGEKYQSIEAAMYQDRLAEQYKDEIGAKHGLTHKQVMELVAEGYVKSWPLIH